jgi:peptide/nickel transport system substrate-binding protein
MIARGKERQRQIFWLGTILFFVGFLFVVPCSAQRAPKGEAVVAISDPPLMTGGDPHTATGPGLLPHASIHEGLVADKPDGSLVPALAKSWEVAKDGMSIKFTLNEKAKFHNGDPVTAKDVKFSYERAMRPEMKHFRGGEIRRIDKIEVIDDHHFTIYFKTPFPGFMEAPAYFVGIIPKAYVEKVGDAEFAKRPIGAGPFRLVDYQQDVFANIEAVSGHYRKTPSVKKLNLKFRVEPTTLMSMLKAGEADIIRVPLTNLPEVKNDPKLRVVWAKSTFILELLYCDSFFPNEPSPFHDVRIRQAASYAINRKTIGEKLLHGAFEPWGELIGPTMTGFNPAYKPTPYDPEKAKALLKEAGYPDGFDTTFNIGHPLGDKVMIQAMAADLARVGIRAKLVEMETGTWIRNLFEKKFHGLMIGVHPPGVHRKYPGIALISPLSSDSPWTYYTTPEFDAAYKKLSSLVDEKAIAAQMRDISRTFHDLEFRSILWTISEPFGISTKVKSYSPVNGRVYPAGLEYLELKE